MNKIIKRVLIVLVALFVVWLGMCYALLLISPKLINKQQFSKNVVFNIKPIQEFRTNSAGDSIDILWIPKDSAQITYLYLHGNGGRLPKVLEGLTAYGNVCSPSYPGYAKSTGEPTTQNTYETVDVAIKFLKEKGVDLKNVVVLGHSLGGSPAMYAAVQYPELKKVITVNTFHSITRMCEEQYKIFCLFSGSLLNTAALAVNAKAPVIICHTPNDNIIPYEQGEALYKVVGSNYKQFRKISGTHAEFNMEEVLK